MKRPKKWKGPRWADYRGYVIETMTTDRDAKDHAEYPGFLSGPVLRAHLVDHPRWGIRARLIEDPGLTQRLKGILRLPHEWKLEVVLSDPSLTASCMQAKGHAVSHWREFVDLWGPGGPMEIPNEEWREDEKFLAWLKRREDT